MSAGSQPRGAIVEIYERTSRDVTNAGPGSLLVPNEVRINGVPLYCPVDSPPVVERIAAGDLVRVTLTVWARRVIIDAASADVPAAASAPGAEPIEGEPCC